MGWILVYIQIPCLLASLHSGFMYGKTSKRQWQKQQIFFAAVVLLITVLIIIF